MKKSFQVGGAFHKLVLQESRGIVDQIIAESTINRQIALGESHSINQDTYVCQFSVMNFSLWVGSDEKQFSRAWYIDQLNSYLKARAWFTHDDKLIIRLAFGRYTRVLGLPRMLDDLDMDVKASVVTLQGKEKKRLKLTKQGPFTDFVGDRSCDGWVYIYACSEFNDLSCSEILNGGFLDKDILAIKFLITLH